MKLHFNWEILRISLWILVGCVPRMYGGDGNLSREDIFLLKDEPNPKCFTRTQHDFTCFFETSDNGTYDFFYRVARTGKKRCDMSVQETEEETFLHICSFPPKNVLLYVATDLHVLECKTNTTLHTRKVSVEEHFLLEPPSQVSLQQNGQVGRLQVSWKSKPPKYFENNMMYVVRSSSKGLREVIETAKRGHTLDSVAAGEEVEVQVSVKCALNPDAGHWSSWSRPVRAVVPQSADDISLMCVTPDLESIVCRWNGSGYDVGNEYNVSYQMDLSGSASGWTDWAECVADRNTTERCSFSGVKARKVRVKLSCCLDPLSRTFYTQEFTLNSSIKASPPSGLTGAFQENKLCLSWEAPLPSLSAHLQYEVSYQIRAGGAWMMQPLNGPEAKACLDVPPGSQYSARVRTKPTGTIYSGHWSDWSDVLTGDAPADIGVFLVLSIPVLMLVAAVVIISLLPKYLSKIKLYFWPPVPNLEKVLQDYLTEINGQRWDPPSTAKQCTEDTIPSVVEVLTDDEVLGLEKPPPEATAPLLSPEGSRSSRERVDGSCGAEVFPDYVTLSKDFLFQLPKENAYVCECEAGVIEDGGRTVKDEARQTRLSSCADSAPPSSDFLNRSYLPLAEPADRFDWKNTAGKVPGNLYSNLPCS